MPWKLAGMGESQGQYYVSSWRYGCAAKGEPSSVLQMQWYDNEAAQQKRLKEFWVDAPEVPA